MFAKKYLLRAFSLGAATMLSLGVAQAALVLPSPNAMSTGLAHDDLYVYPLELIAKCAAAGDARCLPSSGLPVSSSTGDVDPLLVIYQQTGGNDNYSISGPLANQTLNMVDNPFRAPSGKASSASSYEFSSSNEPGYAPHTSNTSPEFSGDLIGTWDARLSTVVDYLTSGGVRHDLVFLFDNNEQGNAPAAFQRIWSQIHITDASGVSHACYELSNFGQFSGCHGNTPLIADYVAAGQYCVDEATGAALPAFTAKAACQAAGHYWLSNNLGSSSSEFAVFAPDLNKNLLIWADAGYYLSINVKLNGLSGGAEQLYIARDTCLADGCTQIPVAVPAPVPVPEPATPWLLALALLAMAGLRRRS